MTSAPVIRKRPPMVQLGDRARIARREMGLNQPQFVQLLQEHLPSVKDKAYATWETGTTPENVVEVAGALERVTGYPWTWFLRGIYEEMTDPDGGASSELTEKITIRLLAGANNVHHVEFGKQKLAA